MQSVKPDSLCYPQSNYVTSRFALADLKQAASRCVCFLDLRRKKDTFDNCAAQEFGVLPEIMTTPIVAHNATRDGRVYRAQTSVHQNPASNE